MPENQTAAATLLVSGASGHLGRRVVELLLAAGQKSIIATTRTPDKLADLAKRGVTVRFADFDDSASLAAAFDGVTRLLLVSTDSTDRPGRRVEQHTNAIKAAEAAGVRHIVYTSIVNPDPSNPAFVVPDHAGTEAALTASKLGFTSLRNNLYSENLLAASTQALQLGSVFSAAGDGKAGYVTREDCAQAAAAALASSFEGRRFLDITGPEAVTQAQFAAVVSSLSGRAISYVPLTTEVLIKNIVAAGLPEPIAAAISTFDVSIAQGKMALVSNDFQTLTGHRATSVADFLAANWATIAAQPAAN